MAQRLVQWHGQDLRYVPSWKSWLVWDSRRWVKDDTDEAIRRVKRTINAYRLGVGRRIKRLKGRLADFERKDPTREEVKKKIKRLRKLVKLTIRLESHGRMNAILAVAQSEPGVSGSTATSGPSTCSTGRSTCGRGCSANTAGRT
jgi:hypothetical protein